MAVEVEANVRLRFRVASVGADGGGDGGGGEGGTVAGAAVGLAHGRHAALGAVLARWEGGAAHVLRHEQRHHGPAGEEAGQASEQHAQPNLLRDPKIASLS